MIIIGLTVINNFLKKNIYTKNKFSDNKVNDLIMNSNKHRNKKFSIMHLSLDRYKTHGN